MNKETLHLVVLGALLHDIGKLFERGDVFADARKDPIYLGMCKEQAGNPTHLHAAHTGAFCDWIEEKFDCLRRRDDRSWKRWCAAHHREDEGDIEATIIRLADRLSSSERDEGIYYKPQIHKKTRLEPVMERVFLAKNGDTFFSRYRYPLVRLTSDKTGLFPVKGTELKLKEMENAGGNIKNPREWSHLISDEPMSDAYKALSSGLMDDLSILSENCPGMELENLLATLPMILERYTANVPSATNIRHPDISLFDHLRTTAAIAQALYLFQMEQENPLKGINVDDEPKWLLACGDFSGIQKFIYNLTNKGAAKGLRGRSFYVQYFCRICANFIVRELELTALAQLYNSGGKFYLLLPAHFKTGLLKARQSVNEWLLKEFGGEIFLGLGIAEVTARMFRQGAMHTAWKQTAEDLERDRLNKFREFLSPAFFEPMRDFDPTKSCPVCGSRRMKDRDEKCAACARLETVGSSLKDTDAILTLWGKEDEVKRAKSILQLGDGRIFSFSAFGAYCLLIHHIDKKRECLSSLGSFKGECVFLNEFADRSFKDLPLPNCTISGMYLGKWERDRQKNDNGDAWDFNDYADNSTGIKRLGILRMDVDNLGLVFINGINFPQRNHVTLKGKRADGWGDVQRSNGGIVRKPMASISRMVTLSRQLNNFFSGYVPTLLKEDEFDKCQIVYAGGDDLFVIGSWDQLPLLAKKVRNEFKKFCCFNPDFSISGGLVLQRKKYPIYKGAQLAGHAEKRAKSLRKIWNKSASEIEKDAFCFLEVPVTWEDFELAECIKSMLESEMERNKGFLSFLIRMNAWNKAFVHSVTRQRGFTLPEAWKRIEYGAWRWRTAYQLRRRYNDEAMRKQWADILFAGRHNGREATIPVYSWLELPLRWTDFLHREKGGKS
ncbi:MAG: type III-A CRISPR-associated protein Cas10/Csm1 [Deltaproteobacteria bacterium]|nr:type III-A CRISPR-associated protein Cas10/Csm1 [Deltaproteobacteria bacterium]